MTRDDLISLLDDYEGVILADGFEDAFIGVAERAISEPVAVYDYELSVKLLMARDGMSEEEAVEYLEYNVLGAYVGEQTPWFLRLSLVESIKKLSGVDVAVESPVHLSDPVAGGANEIDFAELSQKSMGRPADQV